MLRSITGRVRHVEELQFALLRQNQETVLLDAVRRQVDRFGAVDRSFRLTVLIDAGKQFRAGMNDKPVHGRIGQRDHSTIEFASIECNRLQQHERSISQLEMPLLPIVEYRHGQEVRVDLGTGNADDDLIGFDDVFVLTNLRPSLHVVLVDGTVSFVVDDEHALVHAGATEEFHAVASGLNGVDGTNGIRWDCFVVRVELGVSEYDELTEIRRPADVPDRSIVEPRNRFMMALHVDQR